MTGNDVFEASIKTTPDRSIEMSLNLHSQHSVVNFIKDYTIKLEFYMIKYNVLLGYRLSDQFYDHLLKSLAFRANSQPNAV